MASAKNVTAAITAAVAAQQKVAASAKEAAASAFQGTQQPAPAPPAKAKGGR